MTRVFMKGKVATTMRERPRVKFSPGKHVKEMWSKD